MAFQYLTLSNLAVSFGAKVQDGYICLSIGSQTVETSVQSTQASRLNWTEDFALSFDSSNPANKELRIEVCSKHPARRLDPCLAKCIVPIQLGRTTSGAVRQEVSNLLSRECKAAACFFSSYERDSVHFDMCVGHSTVKQGIRTVQQRRDKLLATRRRR